MNLIVRELTNEDQGLYEDFLKRPEHFEHGLFYHTWEWGEFMSETMKGFCRVGVFEDDTLIATAQAALRPLRFGAYWYIPRGALIDYEDQQAVRDVHTALKSYFKGKEGAAFLRVDPNLTKDEKAVVTLNALGAKEAGHFVQAQRVWMAEIQDNEEAQFAWLRERGMSKSVPGSVRRGTREGVTCRVSTDPKDFKKFMKLLGDLHVRKGGIGKRDDSYYEKQFSHLAPAGIEQLFVAEHSGNLLAMNLMATYNKEAGYVHAASADIMRELRAPQVLHFYTMRWLHENRPEVKNYNFWGIVSAKNRKSTNPHNGYSEFKRSFGGYEVEYMNPRDFVYNWPLWVVGWLIDQWHRYKVRIW